MQTLYEKIGGEEVMEEAMQIFYRKAVSDPNIGPFFEGVDFEKQRLKQKAFLTIAFGGVSEYTGDGLRKAHKRLVDDMGLNDVHFDAVLGHMQDTLKLLGVSDEYISEATDIIERTRDDVLNR